MRRGALVIAAAALLSPLLASAHEVLHAVEPGRAVAVKAYFADGEVLAYTQYEVFSPNDARIPYQKGRTDRNGYLAFVPDAAGKWRVKVVDDTGHGLDLAVDADASAALAGGSGSTLVSSASFILRPLIGLAVIAAVFFVLHSLRRRRGASS